MTLTILVGLIIVGIPASLTGWIVGKIGARRRWSEGRTILTSVLIGQIIWLSISFAWHCIANGGIR